MTYKYNDKVYEFALNGQTAKFVGEPPLSKSRLAAFCLGLGAAAAVLTMLLGVIVS